IRAARLPERGGYDSLVRDEMPASVLPTAAVCDCGCGRILPYRPRGRHARFATAACREAARRRRKAGLPEDLPRRVRPGGRRAFRHTPLTLAEVHRRRLRLLESAAAHGIRNVRVFGSVARRSE